MNKAEERLKCQLTHWMREHLIQAREDNLTELINLYGVGEVNTTRLAEEAAYDSRLISEPDTCLNDSTHIIWDIAIDVAEWYERRYSGIICF